VTRSIWHQVLGNCKTEASAKPVPMDSYMAEDLLRWRRQSVLRFRRSLRLRWRDREGKAALLAGQPHEARYSANCESNWHSQENRMAHPPSVLRHVIEGKWRGCQKPFSSSCDTRTAGSRSDVHTQAMNSNKRAAQSKVVRMMVSDVGQTVEEKLPQTRR
jgi:hypothetical protein